MKEMLRLRPTDIIMSAVLLCCSAALFVIYLKAPAELVANRRYNALTLALAVCDLPVIAALMFKGGFFRLFSLTAWTAKLKGIDRKKVYPTQMYVMGVKVFALMMCLANMIFLILVIRLI